MEWCLDAFVPYAEAGERRPGDGAILLSKHSDRVRRGGGFKFPATFARSAWRRGFGPMMTAQYAGVRPIYPGWYETEAQAR